MKKFRGFSLLLSVFLAAQCLVLPARATALTETTMPPEEWVEDSVLNQTEKAAFGTVCIRNGCRSINGMVPLGGSDRKLTSAQGVFLYEVNTNTVVYSYNPDTQLHPGNLTKMVTSLLALENCALDEKVTISTRSYASSLPAGAQNAKLKEGEILTVEDLVYLMMMTEANDAAVSVAEHVAGTQQAFLDLMNQRVKMMGCTNTNFGNVHGQTNNASVTTARDMAKITVEAMKNPDFLRIFKEFEHTIPETNRSDSRELVTHNYMIDQRTVPDFYDKNVIGGMPGYDSKIGAGLICVREEKDMTFLGVVLGCQRIFDQVQTWKPVVYANFDEMTELLKFGFDKYKINRILYDGMTLKQFPVEKGESNAVGITYDDYDSVVPINAHMDNLVIKYYVDDLKAPLKMDEKIGTFEIWYRESCMAEGEMFSMGNVQQTGKNGVVIHATAAQSDSDASGFLSILGTICVIILGLVVLYLGFNAYMRSRMRARRRKRREARRRAR